MDIAILKCPVCPHCGVENVAYQLIGQFRSDSRQEIRYQLWICGHCKKPACSYAGKELGPGGHSVDELIKLYPLPEDVSAPYGAPEEIANSFRSAKRFLLMGKDADYEAACVMARRGIEQAVNNFGGEGKNLFQKINDLEAKRLIPPAMRDWAHHIREIGNEGAHGSHADKHDAEQAVYFAEMLFTYLYTLPTKMAEYQQES